PAAVSGPLLKLAVRPDAQLSVTDAVPKAALICAAVGLHDGFEAAVTEITGACVSTALKVCVQVLLQTPLVMVRLIVYAPHVAGAITETVWPVDEPEIVAEPLVIDQA